MTLAPSFVRRVGWRRGCAALAAILLSAAGLLSQQAPPDQRDQQAPTIRVEVDVVSVFATVKDKKGRLITNLSRDDFEVFEDGQRQPIRYFSRESDLPLTIGLLVDTSVSQGRLVPAEREAAEVFFHRVLRPKDMAFLISFDTDVDLLADYTNNGELLNRGLEKLRVNAAGPPVAIPSAQGPFPSLPHGGTHLYDAVYLAAREKLAAEVGRKTIILISDGEEQGSKTKLDEAIEQAQKADVIIYGILFYDRAFYYGGGMGYSGDSAMKKMAEETGGRLIRVDREKELPAAFDQISEELRSQYSIGYTPAKPRSAGGFRKLRIKTRNDDLKVQARRGYYAEKQ